MTSKAASSPARSRATRRSSPAARSSARAPRRRPVTGSAAASIRRHSLQRAAHAAVGGTCWHVGAPRAPDQLAELSSDFCLAVAETHLPKALRWLALVPYFV